MAYLLKADFSRLIAVTLLDQILEQAAETSGLTEDVCLENAQSMAVAEVKAYLNKLWNMNTEFALTTGRNENVMRAVIHITLYNLHFTINFHDIPEMRRKAYDALTGKDGELSQVRDGVLDWDLPAYDPTVVDTTGMGRTTIGSARKFISKPFTDPSAFPDPGTEI